VIGAIYTVVFIKTFFIKLLNFKPASICYKAAANAAKQEASKKSKDEK